MTTKEYTLLKLAEECAEITQRVTKALRFGLFDVQPKDGRTNQVRIVEEIKDLFIALNFCHEYESLPGDWFLTEQEQEQREERYRKYLRFAREQNQVTD